MAFGCDCISTKFEDHTTILNHSAIAHFAAMTLCYLVTKGRGQGHVTYFLNSGTPSVTFERVKLDTSFFLYWIGHGEYYPTGDE